MPQAETPTLHHEAPEPKLRTPGPNRSIVEAVLRAGRRMRQSIGMLILWPVVALLVLVPALMVVYAAFVDGTPRPGQMRRPFTTDYITSVFVGSNAIALRNSIFIGVTATLFALVWGTALAWIAARTDAPGKWIIRLAGIAPLFLSPLVGAFAWTMLGSQQRGHISLLLDTTSIGWRPNIYSMAGLIFVLGLYYTPYVFLFANSAMTLANPQLEEAGQVHGASKLRVLFDITIPLAAPAVLGAGVLAFILIVENFAVVQIIAVPAGIPTMPGFIYGFMNRMPMQANQAAAIGILMTILSTVALILQRRFLNARQYTTVTGKGFRPRKVKLGNWRYAATGLAVFYLLFALVLPFFSLSQAAFRPHTFFPNAAALFTTEGLTTTRFRNLLGLGYFRLSLKNSLITASFSGFFGTALYVMMSYMVYRTKHKSAKFLEYAAMVPLALPALVISLGFLWTWLLSPIPLYGTLTVLVLAYIARFVPQGFRSVSSTIQSVHPDLEDSAVVAGSSRVRAVLDVTVPLVLTGVVSTVLLMVILSLRELSASLFLFTSRTRVLSILVFDLMEAGQLAEAATVAIVYSLLLLAITLVAAKWFGVGKVES